MAFMDYKAYPMPAPNALDMSMFSGQGAGGMKQKPRGPLVNALSAVDSWGDKNVMPHLTSGGSPIGDMVHGFARGLAPESYDQGRQKAMDERKAQQEQQMAQQKAQTEQLLAFGENLSRMPEPQRVEFVRQRWNQLGPVLTGGQNMSFEDWYAQNQGDLTDAGLAQEMTAIRMQSGMAPPASPEMKVVNNQLVNPTTGEIIGDYRDFMSGAEGTTYRDPRTGEMIAINPKTATPWREGEYELELQNAESRRMNATKTQNGVIVRPDGTVVVGGSGDLSVTGPSPTSDSYLRDVSREFTGQGDFDNLMSSVDEALPLVGSWTAGMGSVLRGVPGSEAVDLEAKIKTIQAQLSFDRLQRMREESKTGGALGAVTERELDLLASTVANLDPRQSPEQLREHLLRIKQHAQRVDELRRQMFEQRYQVTPQGGERTTVDPRGVVQGEVRPLKFNPASGEFE